LSPQQTQPETIAESLIPPRPNPGPEPWPEERSKEGWLVPTLIVTLIFVVLLIKNRRQSRRLQAIVATTLGVFDNIEPSPRERLIAASEQLREAMFRAFGPGWRSKTTEEIGRDPILIQKLDPAEYDHLIAFLKQADLAKFANFEPDSEEDWEAWVNGIAARLTSPQDARSMTVRA
jgi:hypothetical protein